MPPKDKYTDPKLRDKVKTEIHNSDKGGAPGQWSARKVVLSLFSPITDVQSNANLVQAQMMASEYKKRGGGYNTSKEDGKDESQKHLDKWTKEEWQTKEGSGIARQEDDSRKRYLPKKAWEEMNEDEKEETEDKKVEESKGGKQFVGNTEIAKEARRRVSFDINGEGKEGKDENGKKETNGKGEANGQTEEDGKSNNTKSDKSQGKDTGRKAGAKRKAKSQPAENEKDNDRIKSLRKRK
ncbi:hypothetical protein PENANT_c039G07191 [Penicillium antarcticum]|uniref:Hypervirulence associated protein TUDOR domain-containing protein n=1 Tax=Penicillium antarcticum TaxID=416450 RepID=A0A1V6PSW7_9EURO|nr:uncharacterized protein N7508_008306 [Penicillium antarcticum]KAJ5298057.1 hypothetical protein N7508_008306 [Penicillium antarcticum]OQD80085.1 hypothetical protein PENANT_c039G07191 [Penicillium antarcticum]